MINSLTFSASIVTNLASSLDCLVVGRYYEAFENIRSDEIKKSKNDNDIGKEDRAWEPYTRARKHFGCRECSFSADFRVVNDANTL